MGGTSSTHRSSRSPTNRRSRSNGGIMAQELAVGYETLQENLQIYSIPAYTDTSISSGGTGNAKEQKHASRSKSMTFSFKNLLSKSNSGVDLCSGGATVDRVPAAGGVVAPAGQAGGLTNGGTVSGGGGVFSRFSRRMLSGRVGSSDNGNNGLVTVPKSRGQSNVLVDQDVRNSGNEFVHHYHQVQGHSRTSQGQGQSRAGLTAATVHKIPEVPLANGVKVFRNGPNNVVGGGGGNHFCRSSACIQPLDNSIVSVIAYSDKQIVSSTASKVPTLANREPAPSLPVGIWQNENCSSCVTTDLAQTQRCFNDRSNSNNVKDDRSKDERTIDHTRHGCEIINSCNGRTVPFVRSCSFVNENIQRSSPEERCRSRIASPPISTNMALDTSNSWRGVSSNGNGLSTPLDSPLYSPTSYLVDAPRASFDADDFSFDSVSTRRYSSARNREEDTSISTHNGLNHVGNNDVDVARNSSVMNNRHVNGCMDFNHPVNNNDKENEVMCNGNYSSVRNDYNRAIKEQDLDTQETSTRSTTGLQRPKSFSSSFDCTNNNSSLTKINNRNRTNDIYPSSNGSEFVSNHVSNPASNNASDHTSINHVTNQNHVRLHPTNYASNHPTNNVINYASDQLTNHALHHHNLYPHTLTPTSPKKKVIRASTWELLLCLNEFIRKHCTRLSRTDTCDAVVWLRQADRSLLSTGWQDATFISPANVVFVYLLVRDCLRRRGADIESAGELKATLLVCLYLAYSYMGNEISYPLKPFLVINTSSSSSSTPVTSGAVLNRSNELHRVSSTTSTAASSFSASSAQVTSHAVQQAKIVADMEARRKFWDCCLELVFRMSSSMLRLNSDPIFFVEILKDLKSHSSTEHINELV